MTLAESCAKALNAIFKLHNRETGYALYIGMWRLMNDVAIRKVSADRSGCIYWYWFKDGSAMNVRLDYGREKAMVLKEGSK